jgi:hypothetical protein
MAVADVNRRVEAETPELLITRYKRMMDLASEGGCDLDINTFGESIGPSGACAVGYARLRRIGTAPAECSSP